MAVLQMDDVHAARLLHPDHCTTPAGLDILNHQPELGFRLTSPSVPRDTPVTGKDVGSVSVVHRGIVDLALWNAECQRAVGEIGRPLDSTGTTGLWNRRWTGCPTNAGWQYWTPSSRTT